MNFALLSLLTILTSSCMGQEPSRVYVQSQNPPPINQGCVTLHPITWRCYKHQMCAALVCDINYHDNSVRSMCTQNPEQDLNICH